MSLRGPFQFFHNRFHQPVMPRRFNALGFHRRIDFFEDSGRKPQLYLLFLLFSLHRGGGGRRGRHTLEDHRVNLSLFGGLKVAFSGAGFAGNRTHTVSSSSDFALAAVCGGSSNTARNSCSISWMAFSSGGFSSVTAMPCAAALPNAFR